MPACSSNAQHSFAYMAMQEGEELLALGNTHGAGLVSGGVGGRGAGIEGAVHGWRLLAR